MAPGLQYTTHDLRNEVLSSSTARSMLSLAVISHLELQIDWLMEPGLGLRPVILVDLASSPVELFPHRLPREPIIRFSNRLISRVCRPYGNLIAQPQCLARNWLVQALSGEHRFRGSTRIHSYSDFILFLDFIFPIGGNSNGIYLQHFHRQASSRLLRIHSA